MDELDELTEEQLLERIAELERIVESLPTVPAISGHEDGVPRWQPAPE